MPTLNWIGKDTIVHHHKRGCVYALLIFSVIITACQTATLSVEPDWETFANQEYTYEFQHPSEVQIEIMDKDAGQIKIHAGTDEPFQVTATRDYLPAEVLYYLDTESHSEKKIGENVWSEFVLPDGYCDATGCTPPLYALQMESGDVLYKITFHSQNTLTELQKQILSTFKVSGRP